MTRVIGTEMEFPFIIVVGQDEWELLLEAVIGYAENFNNVPTELDRLLKSLKEVDYA